MPTFPAAVGIVSGVLLANIGVAYVAIAAGVIAFAYLYKSKRHYAAFFLGAMALGAASYLAHQPTALPESIYAKQYSYSGKILHISDDIGRLRSIVRLDSCQGERMPAAKCLLQSPALLEGACPGAEISFKARLRPLCSDGLIPYEFDYDGHLENQGVSCTAWTYGEGMRVIEKAHGWRYAAYRMRASLFNAIADAPMPDECRGFMLAAILADDTYLSADVYDEYKAVGVQHVLALSGLHVGILATLLTILLFPLHLCSWGRVLKPILTILLIWMYAMATGMGPSVVRASVMITAYIMAGMLQRSANAFNSLCLAATLILAFSPMALFEVGFQLSFAAVLSILAFVSLLPRKLGRRPVLNFMVGLVVVPIAAMIGTGLISAAYFHALPWLFLPANIACGIIFPWLLGTGMLVMLLTLLGIGCSWLGIIVGWLFWLFGKATAWLAGLNAMSDMVFVTPWAILPWAMAIALFVIAVVRSRNMSDLAWMRWPRPWAIACYGVAMLAVCVAVSIIGRERVPDSELYIPKGGREAIILCHKGEARLVCYDAPADTSELISRYDARFAMFLRSRGARGFSMMPDSVAWGPFYKQGGCVVAGDKLVAIANGENAKKAPGATPSIVVVGAGFKGDALDIDSIYRHPASLYLSRRLSPAKRDKIESHYADTMSSCRRITIVRLGETSHRIFP